MSSRPFSLVCILNYIFKMIYITDEYIYVRSKLINQTLLAFRYQK